METNMKTWAAIFPDSFSISDESASYLLIVGKLLIL